MTVAVAAVPQGTPSEVQHQEQHNPRYNINQQGKELLRVVHGHHGRIVNYASVAAEVRVQTWQQFELEGSASLAR
jgi:hypothetical protein